MAKQVQEVKEKKAHVAKPKTPNFSEFNNLNPNAPASTQTVSNKKLLKPILHSIGLTLGSSSPIANNSKNEALFTKLLTAKKITRTQYLLSQHAFMGNVSKQTVL